MLQAFAYDMTYDLVGLDRGTRLADALNFFIYDTSKIFLLLAVIIFIVSVTRSYFPPEQSKIIDSNKKKLIYSKVNALVGEER